MDMLSPHGAGSQRAEDDTDEDSHNGGGGGDGGRRRGNGNGRGGGGRGSHRGGGGGGDKGTTIPSAKSHPGRYPNERNKVAKNFKVAKQIRELVSTLDKEVHIKDVMRAAGTSHYKMKQWPGYEEGICPAFSSGECDWGGCKCAHLLDNKLPNGYAESYCKSIAPGVAKIVSGQYEPEAKRQRRG